MWVRVPPSRPFETIYNYKEKTMSYHGNPPDYARTGIAVVNPLIRIERKLKRIQEVLDNIGDSSMLTAIDLKIKIQNAIAEEDAK